MINNYRTQSCGQQWRRWFESFTKTEIILTVLEIILLLLCILLVIFIVIHFMICPKSYGVYENSTTHQTTEEYFVYTTADPSVECTWDPSAKTQAHKHYFENGKTLNNIQLRILSATRSAISEYQDSLDKADVPNNAIPETTNEMDDSFYKNTVLALVKINSPNNITFGCILIIVSKHWTMTTASCLKSLEIDSCMIMDGFGELKKGNLYSIADVKIHPKYAVHNISFDLAALKTDSDLSEKYIAKIPSLLDMHMSTIGQLFTLVGFENSSSPHSGAEGRRLQLAKALALSTGQCLTPQLKEVLSLGEAPADFGACRVRPLCLGMLRERRAACTLCGGAVLLAFGAEVALLGLMAAPSHCSGDCEPSLAMPLALSRDWLQTLIIK